MRSTLLAAATLTLAATGLTPTASAAAVGPDGWHVVHEKWRAYPEDPLTLPAARYCGDFDLNLTSVQQGVKVKTLTRWDDGTARTEFYTGVLRTRATNLSTGSTVVLNLSGTARVLYRPDGTMQRYETRGPVGFGWPTGSGPQLPQGYYRFTGKHVVNFTADGTRTLTEAHGQETDVCALVR